MSAVHRTRLVPEVLQASLTDCGPAALKAVLGGFGIAADYDVLRERCETDVDGTSIDSLAALGAELGLESRQVLVPWDHLLLPEAGCLPAIVVTRSGGGLLHFVVVWKTFGPFVQIMDPGSGRRWLHRDQLSRMLPDFPVALSVERWRRWAETGGAQNPWRRRLRRIGLSAERADALLASAAQDPSWRSFARLDAGLRMIATLVAARAVRSGREAESLLAAAGVSGCSALGTGPRTGLDIPPRFWWASDRAAPEGKLIVRGGVIVHFTRRTGAPPSGSVCRGMALGGAAPAAPVPACEPPAAAATDSLPESCRRLASGANPRPMRLFWKLLCFDSARTLAGLAAALVISSALVPVEVLLLRGLLNIDRKLSLEYQRMTALTALVAFLFVALWLDLWVAAAVRRLGRGLEMRIRLAFLEKLPRLEDRYLRSRPSSDMAGRGHALHQLRDLPALWLQIARAILTLLFTTGALLWLFPASRVLAPILALAALVVPFLARRSLGEASLRLRTHTSALDRFYLDALLGASPVRVHGAERAVRAEHEELLTEWSRTAQSLHTRGARLQALQLLSSTLIAVLLVLFYVTHHGAATGLLLLAFWALRVPSSAMELATSVQALRNARTVALRLVSPLGAPSAADAQPASHPAAALERGVSLQLTGVSVRAGGHLLLHPTDLEIAAGSQVAIVGTSGAGKSTLIALLLGWLRATQGNIRVDGEDLDGSHIAALRAQTAWVDPAGQLWEQSLYDNLTYGDADEPQRELPLALSRADLLDVLERLPDGMQSDLGESGARVSGGQGQRVRLGRALMRRRARLVLLDEPFRGLERSRRRVLLERVRMHWPRATLLFVSHDIRETLEFDRVLVLDRGQLVEDGVPAVLAADASSRYATLLNADQALDIELWSSADWRRLSIADGRLEERVSE